MFCEILKDFKGILELLSEAKLILKAAIPIDEAAMATTISDPVFVGDVAKNPLKCLFIYSWPGLITLLQTFWHYI